MLMAVLLVLLSSFVPYCASSEVIQLCAFSPLPGSVHIFLGTSSPVEAAAHIHIESATATWNAPLDLIRSQQPTSPTNTDITQIQLNSLTGLLPAQSVGGCYGTNQTDPNRWSSTVLLNRTARSNCGNASALLYGWYHASVSGLHSGLYNVAR